MDENHSNEDLARKLEQLTQQQLQFQQEISDIKRTLAELQAKKSTNEVVNVPVAKPVIVPPVAVAFPVSEQKDSAVTPKVNVPPFEQTLKVKVKKEKTPLEEFIGTNLLNKIGIAVLVIGVGIGAEYAIDHDLINPLTRILLGYLCGIILIGLSIKLKPKYESFSAVLVSGGMAVLYIITFLAYDLYQLFPQFIAFALMVMFTAFTVFAALQYNLQVVAIIGLVGAYAVPFLLSNGSGKVGVLFTYMAILNAGILILSFKKSWKILYYLAPGLTWLIFAGWYLDSYNVSDHLWLELIFSTIFFGTFYASSLAYKLIRNESLTKLDITIVLLNSFIYYGFGFYAIEAHDNGEFFLGLFTLFNAVLHFGVCVVIYRTKGQSRDIFLFAAGLVLVFLTLAVPVQLDGNWVTIIWAAEAVLLFWIGRTKNLPGYEKLTYPLIVLTFGSLWEDWAKFYGHYDKGFEPSYVTPFLNVQLLTSLLVCAAFGWIIKISYDPKYTSPLKPGYIGHDLLTKAFPVMVVLTLYGSFFAEVENYWQQRFIGSQLSVRRFNESDFIADYDVLKFKTIWLLNYTAIFVMVLGVINWAKLKNAAVSYTVVAVSSLTIFLLITTGLLTAAELRASYLNQTDATYYFRDIGHLLIRYVVIALTLMLLWLNYVTTRLSFFPSDWKKAERVFFHFVILAILSSELVSSLALTGITHTDKLALSILWGAYALGLIVYGLIKDLKYLRMSAIVLFGVTLVKLFFYDLSGMTAIAKTVVMMILGVLLLTASFLYNKFKRSVDEKKALENPVDEKPADENK